MKSWVLIFISVLLGALGQVCMKSGMSHLGPISLRFSTIFTTIFQMLSSPFVLLGLFLYAVSTIFWLTVLSRLDLSYAYPMISVSYALVLIFSWIFFQERFGLMRFFGVLLICGGVFLVSRS
ncbi:EamA family transporter [Candidatus Aerophobetes bacterium]|nr:EamA family transporter [Candidatus Aerophobetes bacterium]